jgi:hypothetical protein
MRGDRKCEGSVFLLAMVALTTLLLLGGSLLQSAIQGLARSSDDQKRRDAFSLAESGVEMAICKLYEDYDNINVTLETSGTYSHSFTLPRGSVSYVVTAPYSGIADSCLIDAVGTTRTNKQARILVIASYMRDVSRLYKGAIFSDSPLVLNGGGAVYPNSEGEGGDIYANGDITFEGTSFDMTGDGSIYTTGTVNWVPPEVPATQVHQNVAPCTMPVIDIDYYESIATAKYVGRTTFNDSNLAGLSGVIFVKGDVSISGNYTGQAVIVATGKIKITGNVVATNPDSDTLALLSPKAITIAGNARVDGLIYAHSVVDDAATTTGGSVEINGAIVADVVRTNGAITITYADVWKGLPLPGNGKTQWAPMSWQELYL